MSRAVFKIENLETPLHGLFNLVIPIARGRKLVVPNTRQKIVILLEGRVRALVNGQSLGELTDGDALVIPGPCRQLYIPLDTRRDTHLHVLVLTFHPGLFAVDPRLLHPLPTTDADPEQTAAGFIRHHFGRVQLRRGALTPAAHLGIESLRREAAARMPGHRLRITAHALLLLAEIARRKTFLPTPPEPHLRRQEWIVEQTRHYLLDHHAAALTLDQIAWHVRLSAEHLARTFRQETGQTIFDYLQQLRLEHAKSLLASTQLPLQEIARHSGLVSATRLCRTFRQATRETPLAYRLRLAHQAAFNPDLTSELLA